MARYFFDSNDGTSAMRDDVGVDLQSIDEVKRVTRDFLFDLGHAEAPSEATRFFTVAVRDEDGGTITRATMALAGACP